jgi:heat shock protein HslJ
VLLALACTACTSVLANERTFDGTSWHVSAINGHRAPPGERFSMTFMGSSFTARMGCNSASGEYRIAGDMLVPIAKRRTEMACEALDPAPIPLMTYEGWGFRVIGSPMRMHWLSGQRLTLTNGAGSIDFERAR